MRKRQGARARVVSLILRELEMMEFYLKVGDEVIQDRQVSAAAIAAFADVSGDRSPNHVDDDEMSKSIYGGRIAHGALLVAFMSACSTEIVERTPNVRSTETPISLGYDRIRFLKPVYVGDKVRLCYTVKEIDATRRRARSEIVIVNQKNETVCVGEHILKWVG
jgi:3-hydroxybutyryl-CoA dehydratase